MINTGARKKVAHSRGIALGGMTEQNVKKLCDSGRDLSIAAIRGAQVTINLEDDFQKSNRTTQDTRPAIPAFVRCNKVNKNTSKPNTIISDFMFRLFNFVCM